MTTYLIKGLTRAGTEVFTFTDDAAATRAAEGRFLDHPTAIFSNVGDLANRSGPSLVAFHNALIPEGVKPVNKFETRTIGAERVFALLESQYQHQPVESEAANSKATEAASTKDEDDMTTKGKAKKVKKAKEPKAPRAKKEKKVRVKKDRTFKAAVKSKGGEKSKATALEMISRKMGATAEEIAERLELSVGSAKNLVWYLRRDGNKIVRGTKSDAGRQPYVMAD